jgi:hypothetical protein
MIYNNELTIIQYEKERFITLFSRCHVSVMQLGQNKPYLADRQG